MFNDLTAAAAADARSPQWSVWQQTPLSC